MPHTLPGQVSALVSLLVCAYALLRGAAPERIGAATLLAGTILYGLVQDRVHWLDPQRRLLAVDMVALVIFAAMTSSSRRIWLIPATALTLLSASLHLVVIYKPNIRGMAYLGMENILGYGMLACLGWGAHAVDRFRRTTSRQRVQRAEAEAGRLADMHGEDVAYEVAERLARSATGDRRRELELVLMAISTRRDVGHRGDTGTRWLR